MTRLLFALGLLLLAAPFASAQGYDGPYAGDSRPVYNGLDRPGSRPAPIRIGVGVGPYVYLGPDLLVGPLFYQDDVVSTTLGVTADVSFPLGSSQLYGRLLGGVLNIGADNGRLDVGTYTADGTFIQDASYNPFLTSETILAEGNLLYYITPPATSAFSPYVFTGLGALIATGDAALGVSRTALALPLGAGLEVRLTDALSIYGEAAYRIGLNSVGSEVASLLRTANFGGGDPVYCSDFPDDPDCKPKPCEDPDSTDPICKPCDDPASTNPNCPEVGGNGDSNFRTRFNSALFTGGLRLSFGAPSAPPPYIPPPPPVFVEPPPPTPPAPQVCDLVELNTLYFDYGSSTLDRRARALLDENVELLLDNPNCCVFIDGFTDTSEYDRFGMPLAGRRAQAVYDYYLSRGVTASRLQIRNRGVATPNCDKEDPGPGCERNRRVESLPMDCERFQYLLENPSY